MAGFLRCLPLLGLALVEGISDASWSKTIDVAGRQRMLTQRMSKEFLLVAKGIDVDTNKVRMAGSINLFDSTLTALQTGDSSQNIAAAPTAGVSQGLADVVALWTPFKNLLQNNVNSVRNSAGLVNTNTLESVAAQNVPLLKQSNVVVGLLVDAAKASGASTNGQVVDIAGRQRMLIQRMCKEALLVGHGIDSTGNMANLKATSNLFASSHEGIILGAPWASIPQLTKMCTLQQMREVTYNWQQFFPPINEILSASSGAEGRQIATNVAANISTLSGPLFSSMVAAVKLYVNDSGVCNPLSSVTSSEWNYLLNNAGKQRFLGQQATQQFMQVANGVDVQESKLQLTVGLSTTTAHFRSLIEGSKANNIPAPPTQQIADKLLSAFTAWSELQNELLEAVNSEVTAITVGRVAKLSRSVLDQMTEAVELYVAAAQLADPSVPAYIIDIAGRQRMLYQKLSKEACLVKYGEDPAFNWQELNGTRDLFLTTHRTLLNGAAATATTPVVNRTKNVCIIRQMKQVADLFTQLEQTALNVAWGSLEDIQNLITLNPQAFAAMNTAVGYYAKNAATCGAVVVSAAEWEGALVEVGQFRALSQSVVADYLRAKHSANDAQTQQAALQAAIAKVDLSFEKILFGSGAVPSPPTQEMSDYLQTTLEPAFLTLKQALGGSAVADVEAASAALLAETENAQSKYLTAASAADASFPGLRIDRASQLIMLANKMFKEQLLAVYNEPHNSQALAATMAAFETIHSNLNLGGNGLPAIIPQRGDLVAQWQRVDGSWNAFKQQVQLTQVASIPQTSQALSTLVAEISAAIPLYGKQDPYVPPKEEGFPWIAVVFGAFGVFIIAACTFGFFAHKRREARGKQTNDGVPKSPSSNAQNSV